MPEFLKLSPELMSKIYPDAKEGDSFQTSVEGTFKSENGQLMPSIDSVEGQPLEGDTQEAPPEAETPPPDESGIPVGQGEPMRNGMKTSPMADKAKSDLIIALGQVRGAKSKDKYA